MAACTAGANRKPMPISPMASPMRSGGTFRFTPSASITSAEPQPELNERLPCLATRTPAPATTNAAALETLNVPLTSPPVPQVSTRAPSGARPELKMGSAYRSMATANPTSSSTVSPLWRSAASRARICASLARPESNFSITTSASGRARSSPASTLRIASAIMAVRSAPVPQLPCSCLRVQSKLPGFRQQADSSTDAGWFGQTPQRPMKIHEYQAKALLARYGVPTPRGEVVLTKEEARSAAERLGTPVVVVKAQIHAGGRGKAGGVKLAHSAEEAAELAGTMLGSKLVPAQTGTAGRIVTRVLIEEGLEIERELYLGLVIDRAARAPVFMVSRAGGVEIEEVARENPSAVLREMVHPALSLEPYQARKLAFALGLAPEGVGAAVPFFQALYRAFVESDASLAEINPCVLTRNGRLVALDAKMTFDDNALYRHKEIREL